MEMGYTFGMLFAHCEIGERVTHQFNLFNEKFLHCNWYLFPIEMQRIYSIVLIGVQDPAIIQGFANTICTRDAFKRVIFIIFHERECFCLPHSAIKIMIFFLFN